MKNQAAVELGRLGGLKGGKARAAALSREERRRIAQKAAETRWRPIPLACPFCHDNNVNFEELDRNEFSVMCLNCGIIGPVANTKEDAIRKWNGQSPPPNMPIA